MQDVLQCRKVISSFTRIHGSQTQVTLCLKFPDLVLETRLSKTSLVSLTNSGVLNSANRGEGEPDITNSPHSPLDLSRPGGAGSFAKADGVS